MTFRPSTGPMPTIDWRDNAIERKRQFYCRRNHALYEFDRVTLSFQKCHRQHRASQGLARKRMAAVNETPFCGAAFRARNRRNHRARFIIGNMNWSKKKRHFIMLAEASFPSGITMRHASAFTDKINRRRNISLYLAARPYIAPPCFDCNA